MELDRFEAWLIKVNEELNQEPTVSTSIEVSSDIGVETTNRTEMMSDIDTIMNSLDTLASELTESAEEVNEDSLTMLAAGGAAAVVGAGVLVKKLIDWSVKAPKAAKAQHKVNTMSIKIAGIESKMSSVPSEKKEALKAKIDLAKSQRDDLQSSIDDRYKDSPSVVQKAVATAKKEGKLEVLNMTLGDASDERKKEIKDQLKKLTTSIKQDKADMKEMEPSEDEKAQGKREADEAAAKLKADQEKAQKDAKEDQAAKDSERRETEEKDRTEKNSKDGKLERVQSMIDDEESRIKKENQQLVDKIEEYEKGIEDLQAKKDKSSKDKQNIGVLQSALANAKKSLQDKMSSTKLDKLKELKDKISVKENWQIDNTELGRLLEMEISLLENEHLISESISIKDKFYKLL